MKSRTLPYLRAILALATLAAMAPQVSLAQSPSTSPQATPPLRPPTPPPPPPSLPDVESMTPEQRQDAMLTMGYAMAQQVGMNIGFTKSDLDAWVRGALMAANGEPQPSGFDESMKYAQALYMKKRSEHQAIEDALAAEAAKKNIEAAKPFWEKLAANPTIKKSDSGLHYEIIEPGNEKKPGDTDRVKVNYRGTLIDGTEFDANMDKANPAQFSVRGVVKGFGEGLKLLGEGGKAKLYIPPELGYGDRPRPGGQIKPGDTLIFEVELLEVIPAPAPRTPPTLPPGLKPPATPPPPPNMKPPGPPPNITPPPPPNITPPPPPNNKPVPPPPPSASPKN